MTSRRAAPARAAIGLLAAICVATVTIVAGHGLAGAEAPPALATTWGSYGSGAGQFKGPTGVALDDDGKVYVVDQESSRVEKFTADGGFLTSWGSHGSAEGQLSFPTGIAVDHAGNVYVTDTDNDRVEKFTAAGTFVDAWGTTGTGDGQFDVPTGVAVDDDGNVYVADTANDRVEQFAGDGTFIDAWGTTGTGDGQFDQPRAIAVDASAHVYVADSGNSRIEKFTTSGSFITLWGSHGVGNHGLDTPYGVATDPEGNVYVADSGNDRVVKDTSNGLFVTKWGSFGSGTGQFLSAFAIAVNAAGDVYVTDYGNNRVHRYVRAAQPDGRIRTGANGATVGNDIYNTTGVGQTRTASMLRGGYVQYYVTVQNDAVFPDQFRLEGTASTTQFAVKYSTPEGGITRGVTAGTYSTPVVAPGASVIVGVRVSTTGHTPPGSSLTGLLIAKSSADRHRRDAVRFISHRS